MILWVSSTALAAVSGLPAWSAGKSVVLLQDKHVYDECNHLTLPPYRKICSRHPFICARIASLQLCTSFPAWPAYNTMNISFWIRHSSTAMQTPITGFSFILGVVVCAQLWIIAKNTGACHCTSSRSWSQLKFRISALLNTEFTLSEHKDCISLCTMVCNILIRYDFVIGSLKQFSTAAHLLPLPNFLTKRLLLGVVTW